MKLNKLTGSLAALGLVSLAGVAHANTYIYLTGSTAARAIVFGACTTAGAGEVFPAGPTATFPAGVTSGASQMVFEGVVPGIAGLTDIICSWTGSEAGIASVAGQNLVQPAPGVNNGTQSNDPVPGIPANTLNVNIPGVGTLATFPLGPQAGGNAGWTTTQALPINDGVRNVTVPDLTMADTSQAVSQTPTGVYKCSDYGCVGVVTFSFVKGYQSAPDAAYNHLVNVPVNAVNQNIGAGIFYNANNYTGIAADNSDGVVVCGRNIGSGTRANALVNLGYPIKQAVEQFAYNVTYAAETKAGGGSADSAQGVLRYVDHGWPGDGAAAGAPYFALPNNTLYDVGNDGFDGGSGVAKGMNIDGSGQNVIMIGYLGVSDAKSATTLIPPATWAANAGPGKYLTFNGIYESDTAVEQGNYPYWGEEHLLGVHNGYLSGTNPDKVGQALTAAIATYLTTPGSNATGHDFGPVVTAGNQTGDVTSNPEQSILIPKSLMQVSRSGDTGYPVQDPGGHNFPGPSN